MGSTIVDHLSTYGEKSPGGRGLRLMAYGQLPPEGRKAGSFECYSEGRYLTFTGYVLGDVKPILHRQDAIDHIHRERFPNVYAPKPEPSEAVSSNLDDAHLIEKALAARNGGAFGRLWNGDWSVYPSRSEADFALCSRLAFWTGGDAEQIDRLFRQSALYRMKWERQDYRESTIANSLAGRREVYTPSPKSTSSGVIRIIAVKVA